MEKSGSEARERVLDVAERLFMERGYAAVTLRDISETLGIKQASLYYHFPKGKEEMFVNVAERSFGRHRNGLEEAIHSAGSDLREQLRAIARWLFSQAPMDLGRMMRSDMPSLSQEQSARLEHLAYESLLGPLESLFAAAHQARLIWSNHPSLAAGTIIAVLNAIHNLPEHYDAPPKLLMAEEAIEIFLNGILARR